MSFLFSWAWWFAAGIPVIVLLYLLRLKRQEATVSSLLFWQRLLEENRTRALWQRLRQWLSLLLHLLIFTLILLALAKPELRKWQHQPGGTVVVLDDRARTHAQDSSTGKPRFETLRGELLSIARNASFDNPVAIIGIAGGPRVISSFSPDASALETAVRSLQPSDASGDAAAAVALGRSLIASRAGSAEPLLLQSPPLKGANAAITQFAARPIPASPDTAELLLQVQNFGAEPATFNAEVFLDERPLDVVPLQLAPGERAIKTFTAIPASRGYSRGLLRVRLDKPDAMQSDNQAFAVLPKLEPLRVLLVTDGNVFLERALQANRLVQFEVLVPDQFRPELVNGFDAVILDRVDLTAINTEALTAQLFFIGASPIDSGEAPQKQLPVTDEDRNSPLLQRVSLRGTGFAEVRPVSLDRLAAPWRTSAPVRSGDIPVIVTADSGSRRMAIFPWDVTASDLPLRVGFPLLVQNTIQWLAGRPPISSTQYAAGEEVPLAQDEKITAAPAGAAAATANEQLASAPFSPMRNGHYKISGTAGERWIAVNTFSEEESNLAAQTTSGSAATASATLGTTGFHAPFPLWVLLALAGFLLFSLEWWLFHTRRTE